MSSKIFADPLNETVTTAIFAAQHARLQLALKRFRDDPIHVMGFYFLLFVIPILLLIGFTVKEEPYIFLLFAGFLITGTALYYAHVMALQHDLVTYLLCEKKAWAFNPEVDYQRAIGFSQLFPDVFARGDPAYRNVDNQIWGSFTKGSEVSFWSGIFHYEETDEYDRQGKRLTPEDEYFTKQFSFFKMLTQFSSGNYTFNSARNDRDANVFDKQVFILELGQLLPANFTLYTSIGHRDMETESMAFNNNFRIVLHNHSKQAKHHTIQLLSPSVQVRLIEFAEQFKLDCITFQHNCMVVLFKDKVWKVKHTNFFKRAIIDERDVQEFDRLLAAMAELPLEMRRYLD